jgi:hypothetical protein
MFERPPSASWEDRSGSEVIGHIAMQQRTSMSDVIVSDTAD